jgi:small GTP-binding protein
MEYQGDEYDLQLWDTAGQERFAKTTIMYCRDALCCVAVCDMSDPASIEHVNAHIEQYLSNTTVRDPLVVIAGNKADLLPGDQKRNAVNALAEFSTKLGCLSFLTSAKTGQNVHSLFESVLGELLKRHPVDATTISTGQDLYEATRGVASKF